MIGGHAVTGPAGEAARVEIPLHARELAPEAVQILPGLHIPLTADLALFAEAVRLGREVIWLHSFGDRFADPSAGRPSGPPRLPATEAPTIPAEDGAIPADAAPQVHAQPFSTVIPSAAV